MKDIPLGDSFRVEQRWDVMSEEKGSRCRIKIHGAVRFVRSIMAPMRSMIESNVKKEMRESVKIMTAAMRESFRTKLPSSPLQNSTLNQNLAANTSSDRDPMLEKLKVLMDHRGLQKLERLLQSETLSVQLESRELKSNYAPSSILPSASWILFLCCVFVLFCQIFLVWTGFSIPSISNRTQKHNVFEDILEKPLKQLHDLEIVLSEVVHLLNLTLSEFKER